MRTSRPGSVPRWGAALVAVALVVGGCSGDDDDPSDAGATTSTTAADAPTPTPPPGDDAAPQETLRAAVDLFLTARVDGDAAAAYRMFGGDVLEEYRDVAEWEMRTSELPAPTGYEVEDSDDPAEVTAVVTHEPGLDPFIGLSPAQERQTFTGVEVDGGWLIGAEPVTEIVLPDDAAATAAVTTWAEAVQACDEAAADALQAVDPIFGQSVGASELCESTGGVTAGAPEALLGGPESADLVAQYSTDAIEWARAVPVTAPTTPFFVIVAPIGDGWQVIGVFD